VVGDLDILLDPRRYKPLPVEHAPPLELFGWVERDAPVLRRCFTRNTDGSRHLLHDTLRGPHGLEGGVYYAEPSTDDGLVRRVVAVWRLGPGTSGHVGMCHGGLVAALLDDAFGCATHAYLRSAGRARSAATASLKVDYRAPVKVPGRAVCEVLVERVEGRKIYCKARFFALELDRSEAAPVPPPAAEASCLFIELKEASPFNARAKEHGHSQAI